MYKLKAGDAKERQWWVSRLHREVELRTSQTFGASLQEVGGLVVCLFVCLFVVCLFFETNPIL